MNALFEKQGESIYSYVKKGEGDEESRVYATQGFILQKATEIAQIITGTDPHYPSNDSQDGYNGGILEAIEQEESAMSFVQSAQDAYQISPTAAFILYAVTECFYKGQKIG
jgi:hypothetical protein